MPANDVVPAPPPPPVIQAVGALQALSKLQPGVVVGERFEVEALADWGGMGAVYRARDRQTGELVALKVVLDAATDERFAREARILAELSHPRIVRYIAHGRLEGGAPYLVMEWLEGRSLRWVLGNQKLSVREAISIARAVAEALSLAHARGVVHRDINPRNVFVPNSPPPNPAPRLDLSKVLDFGIARPAHATWALTMPGSQLGTPGYMSPEQARGDADVDARADVFSLGCVLFECLAGRAAFVGEHMMALLSKVLLEEPPRLSLLRNVPPELDDLVARMLSKQKEQRPRTDAVLSALSTIKIDDDAPASDREEAPPASLGEVEQRLVCVVMAGAAAQRVMLNDAATLASEGAEVTTRARLGRFGAKTEWLADGSVVATLTGDGDARDHAAQAARFALALREIVHSGPIVLATGRGVVTGRTPVGEVLERAARLLQQSSGGVEAVPTDTGGHLVAAQAAPKSGVTPIRIDDVTAGLLDLRFDVSEDPIGRELRGTRDSGDSARTVLGRTTSCVGRDRDLATLEATFAECASESVARVVLVTAAAGLGKSRVRREFLRRVRRRGEPLEVFFGRGDAMSAGAPFAMLAMAVRGAAGVADAEPITVRRQKLTARVARHVPEGDRARIAEFLGELIGAPFPDDRSVQLQAARRDPTLRGDQMRRAWEDWMRAECRHHPVLIVLEDLHWGDLPTVKAIDATLRNLHDQPLMVLALARPEVDELFPHVFQQRGVAELRLGELTKKASERLVREVLGDAVKDDVVQRLIEHAAGNPFCLEELLRAEAEGRSDVVPGTVLATAQARLERLSAGARRVLRAGSVFGDQFWRRGVVALLGGDARAQEVAEWLHYLSEREVVTARAARKFPGEDEYAFQHAIVREAAYAMLTHDDRTLGHRLAGDWLEAAGEADAMTLAQHFERGAAPERAVRWYLRAAEQALEGGDLDAVISNAARGLAQGASGESLGALKRLEAEARKWRGDNAGAMESARVAMELLPRGGGGWCAAAGELAAACGKLGKREELVAVAEALLSMAPSPNDREAMVIAMARTATQLVLTGQTDTAGRLLERLQGHATGGAADRPGVAAWVLEARAISAGASEDPGARVKLAEASADAFEVAGDMRNACLQRVSVGYAYVEIGAFSRAERALREALSIGERMALDNSLGVVQAQLGRALARVGTLQDARAMEERAIETLQAQKNHRLEGIARSYLAQILLELGDVDAAERSASQAVVVLASAPAFRCAALATLARVRLTQGRHADALAASTEAIALLESAGKAAIGEASVRLVHHEALAAVGDRDAARATIALAKERLLARAAKIGDRELRAGFLAQSESARTLCLADATP